MAKRRKHTPKSFDSKAFREQHGMTSANQLADAVGVHERTVRNWDSGDRVPSRLAYEKIKQIAADHKAKQQPAADEQSSSDEPGPVRQGFLPSAR